MAKRNYCSTLITPTCSQLVALFKAIQFFLTGVEWVEEHLQDCCEHYWRHLLDKATHIYSVLNSHHSGSLRLTDAQSGLVIWEQFECVSPKERHWVFKAVSITTRVLDPHPSWLIKASWGTLCSWIQKLVKSSFREGMAPMAVFHPVPKKMLLNPTTLDNFCTVSNFCPLGQVCWEGGQFATSKEINYLGHFQLVSDQDTKLRSQYACG